MTFKILFWITIGVLAFIVFICLIIFLKKQGEAPKTIRLGKTLLAGIGILLLLIVYSPEKTNYNLMSDSYNWEGYNMPQIDTLMYLNKWDNDIQRYSSWSTDSIRHVSKIVEHDLFNVYKIEDLFINENENIELMMTYITPSIIRNEKRLNILQKRNGLITETIDTLNTAQTQKLLTSWGFKDDLFKTNQEKFYR